MIKQRLKMHFFGKPLIAVDESDLVRLITNEVREGKSLDYKLTLPADQTEEKKEFLADVCSFANTGGGHIIFGVAEEKGVPTKIVGVSASDLDATVLRLESSIRDGIEPRIPLVRIQVVRLSTTNPVLILEIGRSWATPHMVTYKGTSRFFARNSAGKYQLDVQEIRAAVLGTETLTQKVREFRSDRVARILGGELGFELTGPACVAVHVCPVGAFSVGASLSLDQMRSASAEQTLRPIYSSGWSDRVTFDGYMRYSETMRQPTKMRSYVQVFRSGYIEAVDCSMLAPSDPDSPGFPSGVVEHKLLAAVSNYLTYATKIGLEGPFVVTLSFLNVRGYTMITGHHEEARLVDRDHLLMSEIVISDASNDAASVLRPAFDALWNACGYERSWNYDESGKWAPKR